MDILRSGLVERPAHEICEAFNVADILVLSVSAKPADRHVLDQTPAQRADGLLGHWGLLSLRRIKAPQSQDRTPASATSQVATNYRESGLVPCPLTTVADRASGGKRLYADERRWRS